MKIVTYAIRSFAALGLALSIVGNSAASAVKDGEIERTYVQEYATIVEVINKYNEGGKQARSSIMKPAFSEKATIYGVQDGKLVGGPIQSLYDVIDGGEFKPSPQAHAAIVSVDIVGTAASARVDTDNISGYRFTDFFQLLKVDGSWVIVSKIYHTHSAPK